MNEIQTFVASILKDSFLEENSTFVEEDIPTLIDSMNLPFKFTYASGASKFVLIPEGKDFVIKIPFTGTLTFSGQYVPYENGEDWKNPWDYCFNEAARAEQAEEDGFGAFFAKTKFLMLKNGFPIYIQPKCTPLTLSYSRKHYSKEERDKTRQLTDFIYIDVDWLIECRKLYGDEKVKDFVAYLEENRWDDDLRAENIGYYNNLPVLIDYSSFNEDY